MKIEAFADRSGSHVVLVLQSENLDDFRELCILHDHIHFDLHSVHCDRKDPNAGTEPAVEIDSKQRQMRILIHTQKEKAARS